MCTFEKAPRVNFPAKRPLYYYITDRHQLPAGSIVALISTIRQVISWGADFVQLREKDLADRDLLRLTRDAVKCACGTSCKILVNGRFDVAVAGEADGIHLPSTGLTVADLKPVLPRNFIVGVSVHSLPEARRAAKDGADYVLLGPVFRTPSKMRYGAPLGISRFRRICAALPLPVFGLGGIRPALIRRVMDAGASGIAGISLFQDDVSRFVP